MNPEFQRYLWTEFSVQRLIVMPVLLIAVFALVALGSGENFGDLADAAMALFALLCFFWATRRAPDAVISELREGTWDAQRMSAQSAFSMTWAKLFGATIYAWYGAAMCLAVYLFAALAPFTYDTERLRWESRIDPTILAMPINAAVVVVVAITGQAAALACAMALMRKRRGERNVSVTFCHMAGFLISGGLYWYMFRDWVLRDTINWYGMDLPAGSFAILSALIFMGWAILAVLRLMRAELLYTVRRWAWTAFALYLALWSTGLMHQTIAASGARFVPQLALALAIVAGFTYLAFFLEEKNQVVLRAWFRDLAGLRLERAVLDAPAWAQLFVISLVLAIVVAAASPTEVAGASVERYAVGQLPVVMCSGALFLLRDLTLLLALNMGSNQRRADAAGFLYLVMLYVLAPLLAEAAVDDWLVAAFAPIHPEEVVLSIASPAVQAALTVGLLLWRLARQPVTLAAGGRG